MPLAFGGYAESSANGGICRLVVRNTCPGNTILIGWFGLSSTQSVYANNIPASPLTPLISGGIFSGYFKIESPGGDVVITSSSGNWQQLYAAEIFGRAELDTHEYAPVNHPMGVGNVGVRMRTKADTLVFVNICVNAALPASIIPAGSPFSQLPTTGNFYSGARVMTLSGRRPEGVVDCLFINNTVTFNQVIHAISLREVVTPEFNSAIKLRAPFGGGNIALYPPVEPIPKARDSVVLRAPSAGVVRLYPPTPVTLQGNPVVNTTAAGESSPQSDSAASKIGLVAAIGEAVSQAISTAAKIGAAIAIGSAGVACASEAGPLSLIVTSSAAGESSGASASASGRMMPGSAAGESGASMASSAGKLMAYAVIGEDSAGGQTVTLKIAGATVAGEASPRGGTDHTKTTTATTAGEATPRSTSSAAPLVGFFLTEATINAIAAAMWAKDIPLGAPPVVTYGSTNLSAEEIDTIAYILLSKVLP